MSDTVTVIRTAEQALEAAAELSDRWSSGAAERDRIGAVPRAELQALKHSGLLAISVPRAYGGAGVSYQTVVQVFRLLGRADGSLAQVPQNHFDFVDLLEAGTEPAQQFFYAAVLAGARFGNALAEKGRKGSELGTTVTPTAGGYLVSGEKSYATGALTADWVPVSTRDADGRMLVAYLDRGAPGLTIDEDWNAFGQRLTYSGSVHLDEVFVPADHVLDRGTTPIRAVALSAGNQAIHAAIEVGIAEGALRAGLAYLDEARDRRRVREPAAIAAELAVAWSLVDFAGAAVSRALDGPPDAELSLQAHIATEEAKSVAYEIAPRLCAEVLDLVGPAAADESLGLDRFWRNSRTHSLHDPGRWRRYYVGDYFLNGTLPELVRNRLTA